MNWKFNNFWIIIPALIALYYAILVCHLHGYNHRKEMLIFHYAVIISSIYLIFKLLIEMTGQKHNKQGLIDS